MGNTSLSSDEMASILGPPSEANMGTFEPPSEANMGDISLSSDVMAHAFDPLLKPIWATSHSLPT